MPIYEYECEACQGRFEYMDKMSAPLRTQCEKCGGKLMRLISPAGFHLKGTGWYKTDYASPRPASNEGGKSESASKPDAPSKESKEPKTTKTGQGD